MLVTESLWRSVRVEPIRTLSKPIPSHQPWYTQDSTATTAHWEFSPLSNSFTLFSEWRESPLEKMAFYNMTVGWVIMWVAKDFSNLEIPSLTIYKFFFVFNSYSFVCIIQTGFDYPYSIHIIDNTDGDFYNELDLMIVMGPILIMGPLYGSLIWVPTYNILWFYRIISLFLWVMDLSTGMSQNTLQPLLFSASENRCLASHSTWEPTNAHWLGVWEPGQAGPQHNPHPGAMWYL